MLIPIGHENMTARRWPVVTIGLIAINTIVFLFTISALNNDVGELGEVKSRIIILAALHPEIKLEPQSQRLIDNFKKSQPLQWKHVQDPYRADLISAYDARLKMMDDTSKLQAEADDLNKQLVELSSSSIAERYAFVPATHTLISYLTANFLHGGIMHLVGNMWFLWLAGFVLEDLWGRWLYAGFYLIAGAAAQQFFYWTDPGSITPALGASGAVAALMGAFLVRLPKMKIEMAWLFFFRLYRFRAPAYCLLPLWLLLEVFYGSLGSSSVAHWAHVGGFLFGVLAAVAIQHSGLEQKANKKIEEKLGWSNDEELEVASSNMEHGQLDDAIFNLKAYIGKNPNSLDAWTMLRTIYQRQNDTQAYLDATVKTCALHLRDHHVEAAFQCYAEFLDNGGGKMPAATWLELCKGAEEIQEFERALQEYQDLAKAYPAERQSLTAQLSAARLCLKKLNRPNDALAIYQSAAASPIPHLDWDQIIQSGIKEARAALSSGSAIAAGAQ
jgi:membrane associated rhomboid family serine protease